MHPGDARGQEGLAGAGKNRAGCAGLTIAWLTRLMGARIQISFSEWGA